MAGMVDADVNVTVRRICHARQIPAIGSDLDLERCPNGWSVVGAPVIQNITGIPSVTEPPSVIVYS